MNNILKKVSFRCVSLILGITLFTNGILAMEPKIDEDALITTFRERYYGGSTGFCTNPSDMHAERWPSLRYTQEAGKYGGEKRKVYVWNLSGICDPSEGFAGLIMAYIRRIRDGGAAGVWWIECGEVVKKIGTGVISSDMAWEVITSSAKFLGVTPDVFMSGVKKTMNVLNIKDGTKLSDILNKCFSKISSKFGPVSSSKFGWIAAGIGAAIIAVGVVCVMEGAAKINERARDIADAETIVNTFLELVFSERYKNANILVMAKDVSELHFYNWDKRGEMPYVAFWRYDRLCQCGAPIFEMSWPDAPSTPRWAQVWFSALSSHAAGFTDGEGRAELDEAKRRLERSREKFRNLLPGGSKRLVEGSK